MWMGALVAAFWLQAAVPAPNHWQAEGLKALDRRDFTAAAAAFQKAILIGPDNYAAHFHLALALSLAGRDSEAVAEYRKTLDLKPDLYEANLNLGILLLRTKHPREAEAALRKAAAAKPDDVKAAVHLGDALLDAGKSDEARASYAQALSLNPKAAGAEVGLARIEARSGNLDAAAQRFARAAELDPAYAEAVLELAEIYESKKQLQQAADIYSKFPDNAAAQERAGEILLSAGKFTQAIPPLESAVSKSPTSANRLALATAYFAAKENDKGATLLNQALAADPKNYSLRMLAGRVLRDHKQYAQAANQFFAAAAIKADSPEPWGEIVTVSMLSENYPQALAGLDRIKALGGENPSHFYLRAIILDKQMILQPALENYQKFLASSQGKFPDEEFKSRQRVRIIQKELSKR